MQEYYTTKQSQGKLERKYDIGVSCVCRWVKEDLPRQANAFPGHGRLPSDQVEMAARQGVVVENSGVEAFMVLRYMGPGASPQMPNVGDHRKK